MQFGSFVKFFEAQSKDISLKLTLGLCQLHQ